MSVQESEVLNEMMDVTPGLQCCLLCGRTLTDRALHDRFEEPVINAIRMEHPEWASADGTCAPCLSAYRKLLEDRLTRDEKLHMQAEGRRLWGRVEHFFVRGIGMAKRISHAPCVAARR